MSYKVDNAIIMAAGTASRFAPLSYERPKSLIKVRGEVLIERQICQLREAGIGEIIVVVGYKKELFEYLVRKYGVILVENTEFLTRNNNSSIYAAKEYIRNSYICSSDNYFLKNPFENVVEGAYYSALFSRGRTDEWCMNIDTKGNITDVQIGGSNAWYMMGHVFWDEVFSKSFIEILNNIYELEDTRDKLWESIYIDHISELKLKIRKYNKGDIFEFDSLDELRLFDNSYIDDTQSTLINRVARELNCHEKDMTEFRPYKNGNNAAVGFCFKYMGAEYICDYETMKINRG